MFKITENKNELSVEKSSVLSRNIALAVFLFAASFSYFSLTSDDRDSFDIAWLIGLSVIAAVALYRFFTAASTELIVDRKNKVLFVKKRSLIKDSSEIYSFDQIADLIFVRESGNSGDDPNNQLVMSLKDGSQIELSSATGGKNEQIFSVAEQINQYIFDSPDQIPFKLTVFYDE